jgi:hypothetical protein
METPFLEDTADDLQNAFWQHFPWRDKRHHS